ncbi:MAG: ABC transporter permease [Planctomycetota bacterium]|nr:MAG: ABC transporter permease [Planctomycetota bacterium]
MLQPHSAMSAQPAESFMCRLTVPLLLCVAALISGSLYAQEVSHSPDSSRVQAHAEALLALGDRSPGSEGAAQAAAYLREHLEQLSDEVWTQRTTIIVPEDRGSFLRAGDDELTLTPHVPNLSATAGTGGKTLKGKLLFLGRGSSDQLREHSVSDAIVVLDGNSRDAWLRIAQMGAQAIIFRHPDRIDGQHLRHQFLSASVPIPRFVADIPEEWDGREVSLTSSVVFSSRQAETLVARIRGTAGGANDDREAVVLASGYESEGAIRGQSPGATRAWNAALTLNLAEQFHDQPLSRDLLVIFHGARPEFFRGLRQILAGITDPAQRMVTNAVGQQVPMGDQLLESLRRQLWRAEEITQDFEDFLVHVEEHGLVYAEDQKGLSTEEYLTGLLENIRNTPTELLVAELEDGQVSDEDQAPLLSLLQWIMVIAFTGSLAYIYVYVRPEAQAAVGWGLVYVFLMTWIIAERPASTAELKGQEIKAEQQRLLELGHRFLSEEAARDADAIRPRLREVALITSYGAQADLDPEVIAAAEKEHDQLEAEHRLWRDIQQKIGRRVLHDGRDGTMEELQQLPLLVERVLGLHGGSAAGTYIGRHKEILRDRIADLESTVAIRDALDGTTYMHLIGVDFSDGNNWWAAAQVGPWMRWRERVSAFAVAMRDMARTISDDNASFTIPFDPTPTEQPDNLLAFWADGYLHEAGVSGAIINSVTLSTINDRRLRVGSPADTADRFQARTLFEQTQGLTSLLREYLNSNNINRPLQNRNPRWRTPVIRAEIASEGSVTGRKAFSYPFIQIHMGNAQTSYFGDVQHMETYWGTGLGELVVPWMPENLNAPLQVPVSVSAHDQHGNITQIRASRGTQIPGDGVWAWNRRYTDLKPVLFDAESSWIAGIFDPRLLMDLSNVTALSASRDSDPDYAHAEVDRGTAAIFTPPGTHLRILASEGQIGNRMALVGEPTSSALDDFRGIPPGDRLTAITAITAAQDFFNLNEGRLAVLRRNGVNPESLLWLHSETERYLEQARESLAQGDNAAAEGAGQAAWAMAGRVYPAVLGTANDVVYGLVVMLLLAIPFAAICERLFYAGNTIYKRVGGFFFFFTLTFLFFFFFHPAFALATTPVIIFLAFAIIVMSALVIGIIFNRFEQEMEMIRMAGLGLHKVDVGRLGTLLATVTLGISNMRRRPLRTFLTAITVVLMTFILLTFASFNAASGTRQVSADVPPSYQGIMLRQNGWLQFSDQGIERIRNTWGDRFIMHERRWLDSETTNGRYTFVGENGSSFVEAVIGIDVGDPSGIEEAIFRPGHEQPGLGDDEEDWLFLPSSSRFQANVEPGDRVTFLGIPMRVGILDSTVLGGITHMDGDPITPLAPSPQTDEQQAEAQRMQAEAASGEVSMESGSFIHLSSNVVAVTNNRTVAALSGRVRSLALQPRSDDVDIMATSEEMSQQLAMSLRVGRGTDTYIMTAVGRLNVAGLTDVLIPLILGGMIIFSTMLGSVAERGKEIFIYASLGLAPIHIGALFLVEASIYAVLGGLGGYILAQLIVGLLGVFADFGIGVQPDLNYSSFTAVITILLVMATVLISALYPAAVASNAANPGTDNSFKVPEPDGDNLEIPFPFTVARRDIVGLFAYLSSYLEAHTEASTGCFTAADATMESTWDGYKVSAKTWLAPFDLGISQTFTISAKPTDMKAIYAIHISMELLSGQRNSWRRVTIPFLKDLRQQFLVWRTLDEETTDRYRAMGGDKEAAVRLKEYERQRAEAAETASNEKDSLKEALKDKNSDATPDDEQGEEGRP